MSNLLFDSWHQWKVCFCEGCKKMVRGLLRIITCVIFGFLSVVRWLWQLFIAFVKKNTAIAIGGFLVVILLTWLLTFIQMRVQVVGTEHQRDSLSYELSKFTQMYEDSTRSSGEWSTVIVDNDTLKVKW